MAKRYKIVPGLSYDDFLSEWNWCWIAQDVEAAAELGRTLLERNRDLESTIRHQQVVLDDQSQEMEYLSKQNTLLRQAAESRLRLCEQMEAAASELERKQGLIHNQLESERQRQLALKTNLEAAEERCEELQRLLDTSRSAEAQSRAHLRAMQKLQQKQQQQQQEQEEQQLEQEEQAFESMEMQQDDCLLGGRPESELAMCRRLIEDMVQVEDRLQQLETEWFQEKSKRQHLETVVAGLHLENGNLQDQLASAEESYRCAVQALQQQQQQQQQQQGTAICTSLSLSEELQFISSGDFTTSQWRDAWDNSGPLSLIGSVLTDDGKRAKDYESEYSEEVNADGEVFIYQRKNIRMCCPSRTGRTPERENDDTYSSSSGFSDENRWIHRSTQTELPQQLVDDNDTGSPTQEDTHDVQSSDYKSLFKEIFRIIHQNL